VFSIVASTSGASLTPILLIIGCANLLSDALSMSVSDFLSSKAENECDKAKESSHLQDIRFNTEKYQLRLFELYKKRGYNDEEALTLSQLLIKDHQSVMDLLPEESEEASESPTFSALWTFASFIGFGLVPLLTFVLVPVLFKGQLTDHKDMAFWIASLLTGLTLYALGAMKARLAGPSPSNEPQIPGRMEIDGENDQEIPGASLGVTASPSLTCSASFSSGLEMVGVGGTAAILAFVIAWALS